MPSSENPDRRLETEASATTGARAWTIVEGMVLTFAIASLLVTLLHFLGSDWLG